MREYHEKQTKALLEQIEKRDKELSNYLEKMEYEKIRRLLKDMKNLLDEMFKLRLRLADKKREIENEEPY